MVRCRRCQRSIEEGEAKVLLGLLAPDRGAVRIFCASCAADVQGSGLYGDTPAWQAQMTVDEWRKGLLAQERYGRESERDRCAFECERRTHIIREQQEAGVQFTAQDMLDLASRCAFACRNPEEARP